MQPQEGATGLLSLAHLCGPPAMRAQNVVSRPSHPAATLQRAAENGASSYSLHYAEPSLHTSQATIGPAISQTLVCVLCGTSLDELFTPAPPSSSYSLPLPYRSPISPSFPQLLIACLTCSCFLPPVSPLFGWQSPESSARVPVGAE